MTTAITAAFLTAGLMCLAASGSRYQIVLVGRTMRARPSAQLKRFGPALLATALALCLIIFGLARGAVFFVGLTTLGGALVTIVIALRR